MAEKRVLDTSFLIELIERRRHGLSKYVLEYDVYIPAVVLYEFLYGYKYMGMDVSTIKSYLEDLATIIWLDQNILLEALEIDVSLKKNGVRVPQADILIAATAKVLGASILTMDKRRFMIFRQMGLDVEIPDSRVL